MVFRGIKGSEHRTGGQLRAQVYGYGAVHTQDNAQRTKDSQNGDTLWNLARRYYDDGSRWKDIAMANDMYEDNLLPGTRLIIPL